MATIIKTVSFCLYLLFAGSLDAHTIYAPNDIPLLDNRFRIDPKTEQITFILNHSKGSPLIVLVRPDGSKLYPHKHPKSVGWVSGKMHDIITINNPMAGPWQAIAQLDGDNRIKLLSKVRLEINKLPLKLYAQEYITTHASLYYDDKLMTNSAYLDNAKLRVSLIGEASRQLMLYQDDGKGYDALPFDGKLTARLYIDLQPGRYLLSIRTKNDIFIRNVNRDAVVFLSPVTYKIQPLKTGSKKALFEFTVDSSEIDPQSVTIDGVIKDGNNQIVAQLIAHSVDNISDQNIFSAIQELPFSMYTFSAKAFATTRKGREIELQLPDRIFELLPLFVMPEEKTSEALAIQGNKLKEQEQEQEKTAEKMNKPSRSDSLWLIIAITAGVLFVIIALFLVFWLKHKKQKQLNDNESVLNRLTEDELQPTSINLDENKK